MFSATVRVWVGSTNRSRCKYCRKPIEWLTTDENKTLPFVPGATPRERVTHPTTGAKFDVMARSDIHDCPQKREAKRATRPTKRPRLF